MVIIGLSKKIKMVFKDGLETIKLIKELESSVLIIHLGMTGAVSFKKINEYKKHKHDHLLIYFGNFILVYNDVRKFGSIHITEDLKSMFLLKHLGPEPISREFNSGYLYNISMKRVCSVKELIMNQKVVVGIGNIYASEILLYLHHMMLLF